MYYNGIEIGIDFINTFIHFQPCVTFQVFITIQRTCFIITKMYINIRILTVVELKNYL